MDMEAFANTSEKKRNSNMISTIEIKMDEVQYGQV